MGDGGFLARGAQRTNAVAPELAAATGLAGLVVVERSATGTHDRAYAARSPECVAGQQPTCPRAIDGAPFPSGVDDKGKPYSCASAKLVAMRSGGMLRLSRFDAILHSPVWWLYCPASTTARRFNSPVRRSLSSRVQAFRSRDDDEPEARANPKSAGWWCPRSRPSNAVASSAAV